MSAASSSANNSENTAVVSPSTPEANMIPDLDEKVRDAHYALSQAVAAERLQHNYAYTTPIDTSVPKTATDRSTPRAQTRQEFEEDMRRRSVRMSLNLAGT